MFARNIESFLKIDEQIIHLIWLIDRKMLHFYISQVFILKLLFLTTFISILPSWELVTSKNISRQSSTIHVSNVTYLKT